MIISKSSWHYKLNNWLRSSSNTMYYLRYGDNVSLCWYFWFTVGSIFQMFSVASITLFLSVCALFAAWFMVINPIISLFALLTGYGYPFANIEAYPLGLFVAFLITAFSGFVLWKDGSIKFAPEWLSKHFKRSTKPAKPVKQSLVAEYIKAKKQKICPLVKLED